MDLQEATLTMALLMKEEHDFYEAHSAPNTSMSSEDLKKLEWMRANTREFGNRLAANPYFFDVMESWNVTIQGTEGVSQESMDDAIKTEDVDDLLERASTLATSIRAHLKSNGYVICGMGVGPDGWDMEIRCSEKKSRDLCVELYQRFSKAISLNVLSVSRRFAGHMLPGLYGWDDAKRILDSYGDDVLE